MKSKFAFILKFTSSNRLADFRPFYSSTILQSSSTKGNLLYASLHKLPTTNKQTSNFKEILSRTRVNR